jgi:hypothetical protein
MDKTIRKVTDLQEQRAENFRYWQNIPMGQRLGAIYELSVDAYSLKGVRDGDGERLRRTLVRVQRA